MVWTAELILTAINHAKPRDCFTRKDVERLTGMTAKQVEHACLKLRKHELIALTEKGCLRLTAAGRAAAAEGQTLRSGPRGMETGVRKRAETMRDRAWRAMRIRRKFGIADLVMLTALGGERDPESNMLKYIKALVQVGILVELPRREAPLNTTSNGCKRWWLRDEADTGPLAPIVRTGRRNEVFDPNTETAHAMA